MVVWDKLWTKFVNKITSEALWDSVFDSTIRIILIILLAWIVVRVGHFIIGKFFKIQENFPVGNTVRRRRTIERLLKSVISYVVYFSAIIAILSAVGINIAGLLAGAGIAGLAIGFGAQSLVKDVITGFFIIFEDQFAVGDYIKLNAQEGTVLEIGLRTTKVKGLFGEVHIIPNGAIIEVINYSLDNSIAYIDFSLSPDASIEKAQALIEPYLQTLPEQYDVLVAPPTLLGVQNIMPGEIVLRIMLETAPLQQYAVSRTIRKDLIQLLEKNGIPLPAPKVMLYDEGTMNNPKGGTQ